MKELASPDWIEFLDNIRITKEELGNPEVIWFRGQGNHIHYLLPSLLRFENGIEKERQLFHKFRRFADKIFKNKESEWETLFDMQHYGLPTRLLDWTESFGISLYFAAYWNDLRKTSNDAAIYLMNPKKLNSHSGKDKILRIPREEKEFPYSGIYWEHKPFKATAPIAIEPIFRNDRILAQRGNFTVHNDDIAPIESKFPDAIKKVMLKNSAIPAAMEFLDLANINEYSVFPDLAGISDYLKNTAGLKPRW